VLDVHDREGHEESFLNDVREFHVVPAFSSPDDLRAQIQERLRAIGAEDLAPWCKLGNVVFRASEVADTVDEIAAAADVGKGTVYNYFRTKEDIVVAFMAGFERKVHASLRDLDTVDRPLADTLTEFIRLQFQMKAPHHRFVRVFFAQMFLRTDQFLPHMAEIHQLTRSTTETLFLALQNRGAIRADVSIGDLTLVFNNVHLGLSALWAIEGPPFAPPTTRCNTRLRSSVRGWKRGSHDPTLDGVARRRRHICVVDRAGRSASRAVAVSSLRRGRSSSVPDEGAERRRDVRSAHHRHNQKSRRRPLRRGARVV
jgi:AcrR family transcriptional regulator